MAEALLNALDGERVIGWSAGEAPKEKVSPMVLSLLQRHDISTDGLHPKSWRAFVGSHEPKIDLAITLCNNAVGEMCLSSLERIPIAHWDIPDPSSASDAAERERLLYQAYAILTRNITGLLDLPEDFSGQRLVRAVNLIGFESALNDAPMSGLEKAS